MIIDGAGASPNSVRLYLNAQLVKTKPFSETIPFDSVLQPVVLGAITGVSANTSMPAITILKASLTAAVPSIAGHRQGNDSTPFPNPQLSDEHGFTVHPTYDYSNSFPDTAYLTSRYISTTLQVSTVTGDLSNPMLTGSRFVTTNSRPMPDINAPQLGPNDNIDAGDNRFLGNSVIVNGKIWGVHTFNAGGLVSIRRLSP